MNTEKRYVVTFILGGIGGIPETNHRTFDSIAEARSWSNYNNYVLGAPKLYYATYSIEHCDGSQLSSDEIKALQPQASEELYKERQKTALAGIQGGSHASVSSLHEGAAHAAIAKSGLTAQRQR